MAIRRIKFVFATGNEFELTSRWTATVRKEGGRWSVIALHFSTNMFDNPLLNTAKNQLMLFSGIAFLLGLLVMFLIAKFILKKR